MTSVLRRHGHDDAELARRVGAGDGGAFAVLDGRHRNALTRYAGSLLRRSEHDAEDVVQDVLIRAHDVLRAGDAPGELRPWLYRLTRNRAIDEVRRKRWGEEALDDAHVTAGGREDPDAVLSRKETLRRLVDDLADLPLRQREALLAREVDGCSPEQVAAQLGVGVAAAQKLALRARENLIKTRDARDADCDVVRAGLLDAHERGVRPAEHGLRHLKSCDACREFQRDLRRLSKALQALNPALGLPVVAGIVKLAGGIGAKTTAGAAAVMAVVATGGIVVLESEVHGPGDPAPFQLLAVRDSEGRPVERGTPVPEGFTIVTARIRLPAGPSTMPAHPRDPMPSVTLPCPKGMKLSGYQGPNRQLPLVTALGLHSDSIAGYSTRAVVKVGHRGLQAPFVFTVGIECRRPDANGSISANPRKLRKGERLAHICNTRRSAAIRDSPGGTQVGNPNRGEPVAIQRRSASGRWTLIATDGKLSIPGWVRTSQLCP